MGLICLRAGAFAMVSKAVGEVDAVVALGLGTLPPALMLPGLFLVAGFVSLSIGTSMGSIAAVVPIALGVADAAGLDRALVVGAVIGGAKIGRAQVCTTVTNAHLLFCLILEKKNMTYVVDT